MERPDIIRLLVREILILALLVTALLVAMVQHHPAPACASPVTEARP